MRFADRLFRSTRPRARSYPDPARWRERPGGPSRLEPLSFRRAPILYAALLFCAGGAATRLLHQPPILWFTALVLLTALTVASLTHSIRTEAIRLVPLAAVWLVLGFACIEFAPAPPPQTQLRAYADGLSRTVRGRIVRVRDLPQQAPGQTPDAEGYQEPEAPSRLSVDLAVDRIEELTPDLSTMVPMTGGIRATLAADPAVTIPPLRCGDMLEAPMRLRLPERYRDPGAWQYADYLLAQGLSAQATIHTRKLLTSPSPPRSALWNRADLQCRLFAAQSWAAGKLLAYARSPENTGLPAAFRLSLDDAGMLNAMLFGDRARLNHQLRLGFERTGSFHLFVVSGMHVGLMAVGLFWIARRLKMPLWAATFFTLILTIAYAAFTGFGVPIQRALWMAAIVLLARLFDRQRNTLNAFGIAILAVVVWSPASLFEASFQMTFLAIVGVAGIAIPLGERTILPYARAAAHLDDTWRDTRFAPRFAQFRILLRMAGHGLERLVGRWSRHAPAALIRSTLWALELCLIALATEFVMVLPMAVYFHRAALFALPANMASVPLIGILVPSALITFCAATLSPRLAVLPGSVTAMLLHAITAAIGRISHAQLADVRVPQPAMPFVFGAAACLALCCWAVRRRGVLWGWAAVALLPLAAVLVLWPEPEIFTPQALELTALDVGQGDALLLVGPTGKTMLIDAGGPIGGPGFGRRAESTGFDIGEEVVAPYLWSRRIRRLDVLALTHEHSDHMGGMPAILRDFRPRELWLGAEAASPAYSAMLLQASAEGTVIRHLRAGQAQDWDGIHVAVLGPEAEYENSSAPSNNDSLVLHMQWGAASILLEGDAEKPEERTMLEHHRVPPVTLLKVAHHGSMTSSTDDFLAAADPRAAIISSGAGNPFGHPRPEVVARFAARGVTLYRTDLLGLTTLLLTRDGRIHPAPVAPR